MESFEELKVIVGEKIFLFDKPSQMKHLWANWEKLNIDSLSFILGKSVKFFGVKMVLWFHLFRESFPFRDIWKYW